MHHRGLRRVQGGCQRAQEAGQQREAQSAPCTEHGPAVAVADVLRYPEHVAGVAGQLEVDPGHARAKGDDAASSCRNFKKKKKNRVRHDRGEKSHFHLIWCIISAHFTLPKTRLPLCGDWRQWFFSFLCEVHLTSHEEEKSGDILHQIMLLTAAQHAYDPSEQDDGDGHADETGGHPLEVCAGKRWRPSSGALEFTRLSEEEGVRGSEGGSGEGGGEREK